MGRCRADYVSYALAVMGVPAADGPLSTIVSIQNSIVVSGLLKDGVVGIHRCLRTRAEDADQACCFNAQRDAYATAYGGAYAPGPLGPVR